VDRDRGVRAFDLAVPVMVTGALRVLLRVTDFLMVGIALGDAAIAGLEIGFQYYFIGFGLALALSSGTISVVSRELGADNPTGANRAVAQSTWLAIALSVPLTVAAWTWAEPLVGLLTNDTRTIDLGGAYLRIVMLSLPLRFFSMVAARALAGAGDTRTPMLVRLVTVPTNAVLNAVLIFGVLGVPALGIVGAAAGTAIANALAGAAFFALLASGRMAVRFPRARPHLRGDVVREIVRVGAPLGAMRLLQTGARFPFLFVLGALGTPVLAAYAIGRRVVMLALMPAWGYATASSTMVGQAIGAGDQSEARNAGWTTLRIGLATQLLVALVIAVAARPIATAFGTAHVDLTVTFVRVFALGVAGFSVDRTMRGALRGAGDTRWPLYAMVLGAVVLRLPIAALALPSETVVALGPVSVKPGIGLGVPGVFAAILADFYAKAAVTTSRFASGRWQVVADDASVGEGRSTEDG
jgi:putative MATE family efflux protein